MVASQLWSRLRPGRGDWKHTCDAGAPVPEPHRCAALHCPSVALRELAEGERGTVSCLQEPGSKNATRLAAYGVLPGVELLVLQRYPAFVLRLGYAEFAIDATLADHIRVLRTG